jgi:ferredoxin-NADP reductase
MLSQVGKDALKVAAVRRHGPAVFELQLHREGIPFVPGDCLALYAEDGRVSRPYSIASGTDEDILRFVIRRMPGGTVSEYLSDRKPGDVVRVSPPFGWFHPGAQANQRPFVFIATGTGVAPFLSHLRSRPAVPPSALLYGVRENHDAVDLEWLRGAAPLRLAVSREKVHGGHHGRVTDLLDELPVNGDTDYYLCGLDAMIDDVTTWLEGHGVDIAHIHRECFFNASYA